MREKIDNAFWKYLDNDNGEKYWSIGYKPMSEYSKYSDYSNDAYSSESEITVE